MQQYSRDSEHDCAVIARDLEEIKQDL
jgi:hypothetical protein